MKEILLITGATSDVGYEYLKSLVNRDKKIIAMYYDHEERLDELIKKFELNIKKVHVNFFDIEETRKKAKEIIQEEQVTEVLHLAALQVKQQRFNKMTTEDFVNDYYIQVISITEILKVILPQMKKSKYGKVVFVLSSSVLNVPPKFWSAYVTHKYALLGLMKALVSEYREYNIRLNGISPSMMETKFLEGLDKRIIEQVALNNPRKRNLTTKEIIGAIEFLFDERSTAINGINLSITGGEEY